MFRTNGGQFLRKEMLQARKRFYDYAKCVGIFFFQNE
jgi:hypothetical protein